MPSSGPTSPGVLLVSDRQRGAGFYNVWLLAACNAMAFAATPLMMLIGSLMGVELAPSPDWATLPITTMVVGAAVGIVPVTQTMARIGRRPGFFLFMAVGILTCGLSFYALEARSFGLFCLSSALLGFTNAAIQQLRFAAMESVDVHHGPTAASIVMCGGIIAAVLGPEMALAGRYITVVEYQGSFVLAGLCFIATAVLLSLLQLPESVHGAQGTRRSRPLREMLQNRNLVLAIVSGAVGYMVMTFVMTGTPISMHLHQGHSLADTKWVIQSHIAAMFLPSLITPFLFRWLRIRGLMVLGLGCYGLTIAVGIFDVSVMGFWYQLVALGVGWNFLFVSGTALLPSSYLEGEAFRAQGLHDSTVFSCQALASFAAGWAMSTTSWQTVLLVCLLPMLLLVFALLRARQGNLSAGNSAP